MPLVLTMAQRNADAPRLRRSGKSPRRESGWYKKTMIRIKGRSVSLRGQVLRLVATSVVSCAAVIVSCSERQGGPSGSFKSRPSAPSLRKQHDSNTAHRARRNDLFLSLPTPQPRIGQPLAGLTPLQLGLFGAGKKAFVRSITEEEGLGPAHNLVSCAACHSNPVGGSGSISVTMFGRVDENGFNPLKELGGPLLQGAAIRPECEEHMPREANVSAERITTSTLGAGLIEAVADSSIARLAESSSTKITGRVHWVTALEDAPGSAKRVGRFGWKCQIATVLSFSAAAAANELGFTNHLLPTEVAPNGNRALIEKCDSVPDPEDRPDSSGFTYVDRVTHFQRYLAAPPQTPRSGMKGEQVFDRIGCAACHVPAWRTADDPSLEAALRHKRFKPYSDFLLHDMGRLGDGIVQGDATGREFRTTPLWGFRFRFPVLHDGRVSGVTSAERAIRCIEAHDGEAGPSVRAYRELGKQERNQLIAFLDSLGRVEFDQDGDNDVDLSDWSFFVGCRTRPAEDKYSPDARCRIADIDGDGDVDLVDFAVLQQAFSGSLYGSVMAVP